MQKIGTKGHRAVVSIAYGKASRLKALSCFAEAAALSSALSGFLSGTAGGRRTTARFINGVSREANQCIFQFDSSSVSTVIKTVPAELTVC